MWKVFSELTPVLRSLTESPEDISEERLAVIQRFVILLYDRTSSLTKVNEVRQELFSKKSRSLESIPPNKAELVQNARRAVYQGGYMMAQTLLPRQLLPCPSDWGWYHDGISWVPLWTTLLQAKDTCYEMIKCGCKTACRGGCKCMKAKLFVQLWRQLQLG